MGRTSKEIRKSIKFKKEKVPCFVCGKHELITEWHHAVPVSDVKEDYKIHGINGFFQRGYSHTMYALCPCCHRYVHKLYKFPMFMVKLSASQIYTNEQLMKFIPIMQHREI